MRGGLSKERLLALYNADIVSPDVAEIPFMGGAGGGLPETAAGAHDVAYFPGGYGTLGEIAALQEAQGPNGMVGGRRRRKTRRRRQSRKQRGGRRTRSQSRTTAEKRKPVFRLNLRAQIRLSQQQRDQ